MAAVQRPAVELPRATSDLVRGYEPALARYRSLRAGYLFPEYTK